MRFTRRKLPFSYLITAILFFIIVIIVLAGIWINYENSKVNIEKNADRLRIMTESHLNNSFREIDTGLKLYDNTYNQQMRDAFVIVMAEYNRTGGDPSLMDLEALKAKIGDMDVYVINDQCVIDYATVPSDIGLDFAVIYPDFCSYLHGIRNNSGFFPDRVVMEWFTGTLTKFSYMPTPDHRYVIEVGLSSERFADERMELQYNDVVNEVREFNPYLEEVLLFQKQKRLLYNTTYVPTKEESDMLDYILWENRTTQEITDTTLHRTVVWEVIDLRDPDYAADMSIFAKLTYNDALLDSQLNRLAIEHAFVGLLVLLSGGLVTFVISRKVSHPIEQLVSDVDIIANGDLDHPIRQVSGYELSTLAERTRIMVERLKEQIRQCEISEKRFMDLVQLLPQAIFETDRSGNVTFANPVAFEIFGYTPEDLLSGVNISMVMIPEDRKRAAETLQNIINGIKTEGSEYTAMRKDGTTFPVMIYSAPRLDEEIPAGVRGTIVDISRLKRIEAEIRRLNAELEHRVAQRTAELEDTTREMEAFTYSVSHDLQAPLRAIDGYSSILMKTTGARLDEKEHHFFDMVRQNVELMDKIINGLLILSRMGRQELNRELISPEPLVAEVVGELLEAVPERQISIDIGNLPPCYADRVMLRQVYANLIGNAVKFTRYTSNPRIVIGAIADLPDTIYFVEDNGAGFDMKYADQIFKPFKRLHRAEEYEGSGIGLATVERIIRRHGGRIWAESEPGKGATFYFTLEGSS